MIRNTLPNKSRFNSYKLSYILGFIRLLRRSRLEVFLKISQNSQENTCARASVNKVTGLRSATLLKKRPWHMCFPVNFAKFLRTPFLTDHLRWLLLFVVLLYEPKSRINFVRKLAVW